MWFDNPRYKVRNVCMTHRNAIYEKILPRPTIEEDEPIHEESNEIALAFPKQDSSERGKKYWKEK